MRGAPGIFCIMAPSWADQRSPKGTVSKGSLHGSCGSPRIGKQPTYTQQLAVFALPPLRSFDS